MILNDIDYTVIYDFKTVLMKKVNYINIMINGIEMI